MSRLLLITCLFASILPCNAQDHAWFHSNNISVRVTPTGIQADSVGGFLFKRAGAAPANLLRHLGPWVGALDPAGNLFIAAELSGSGRSDWKLGYKGVPNSDKVWKVMEEQIAEHLADFRLDGHIDNPIPEIFGWPGRGNAHMMEYNGFPIWAENPFADFYDNNDNGIYEPEQGDCPQFGMFWNSFFQHPLRQVTFSLFYNDTIGALSKGRPLHYQAGLTTFSITCNDENFFENTIFLRYEFRHNNPERLDSICVGMYADFDIGNPQDDYIGSSPYPSNFVYAYNSDTLFDAEIGMHPPALNLSIEVPPLDTFGNLIWHRNIMPIHPDYPLGAVNEPVWPTQFYNFLNGYWNNGNPLQVGGIGFSGPEAAPLAYPGRPCVANEWSELSANNPEGNRMAVISAGSTSMIPGYSLFTVVALSASGAHGVCAQVDELDQFRENFYFLQPSIDGPGSDIYSICSVPVKELETHHSTLKIEPNPSSGQLKISAPFDLARLELFDFQGKLMCQVPAEDNPSISINITQIPIGIYFVRWYATDGKTGVEKVIIAR